MPDERENYEGIVRRGLKEEWCGYIRHFRLTSNVPGIWERERATYPPVK